MCMTVNCHVTSVTEMACTRVTTAHLSGIVEIVIYDFFFFNVHGCIVFYVTRSARIVLIFI